MSRNLRTAFVTLTTREIYTLFVVYKLEKKSDFTGHFSVRTLFDGTHVNKAAAKRDLKSLTEKGYLVVEYAETNLTKGEFKLYGPVMYDYRITNLGRLYVEEICANVFGCKAV